MRLIKSIAFSILALSLLACGGTSPIVSIPIQNIDALPLKVQELSENELKSWWHKDLTRDTIPGMSVDRTYNEIIKKRKGQKVIVGVIDSGIDIEHEDLKSVIWVNRDEIPNNGIDDDGNGYTDDINGWNFLGDIVGEQMEFVRIMLRLAPKYEDKPESAISTADRAEYALYQKAKAEYLKEKQDALNIKLQYESMIEVIKPAHEKVAQKLQKENYTSQELSSLNNDNSFRREVYVLEQMFQFDNNIPKIIDQMESSIIYYGNRLDHHFNIKKNFRETLGDNPYDILDVPHGNNHVSGPNPKKEDAEHGTHVAGIIAAQRDNGIGINGVAQNVEIMALRAVPDGDEYDKDIALAIRYAVDNGAKVINTSFGKFYSPNPEWVYDAINYAALNDVLIVNASGNDAFDLDADTIQVYPNDQTTNFHEFSDAFLSVGALTPKYGAEMIASFSNYGKNQVDVFAPGVQIWSTTPNNEYEFQMGTSFAAPAVAGVAAMLRSYYPQLSAGQVKQIIMDSGLTANQTVLLGGEANNKKPFSEISKSGKMVNMYNAFILAEKISKQL